MNRQLHPRIMKGAFVELLDPMPPDPVIIPFQFNPETISRTKRVKENPSRSPGGQARAARPESINLGEATQHLVSEWESFTLTVRLDAQDAIALGDERAKEVGISHILSTFEKLITPQPGGQLKDRSSQAESAEGYSYSGQYAIPVALFTWGKRRSIPIHLNSLQVEETLYLPNLYPIRATLSVGVKVLEGPADDPTYLYTYQENEERESLSEDFEDNAGASGANSVATG